MQSGGGGMNAAQIARLQQQLAQYGRGNTGGQNQMINQGGMGGMVNPQQQQQQQLQQAFMQQQQMQNQNQGGMQMRRNSSLGIGNNSAAALAMMQQQQQQGGNSQMTNANMSSYWNALQNQGGGGSGDGSGGGAMDASSASSAQLAALTGMSMGGNSGSSGQNNSANLLLGNRGQSQGSQQSGQGAMSGGINMQGMGQTNDAATLQQQIAQLQRQLQQHQQGGQQNQTNNMQGGLGGNSSGNFNMQGQSSSQQQQLFQQMQQMGNQQGGNQQGGMGGNDQFSNSMAAMMGGSRSSQSAQNMQQNLRNSMTSGSGSGLGGLGDSSDLLQQQNLLRSSSMSQNMQNDASKAQEMFMMNQNNVQGNNQADLMGQRRSSVQQMQDGMNQSMNSQSQNQMNQNNIMNNNNPFDMDGSMSSQRSNRQTSQGGSKPNDPNVSQKSFLDGSFAGGWQSNADLPDRRRIIFSILEVIRQMRPDTNKISQKLPHMAKSLEEHLYRSAQTKEEYLDPSTLKKRLQLIAHGLELHRSTSSGSMQSSGSQNNSGGNSGAQQLQQLLQMQGGNMNQNQQGMGMAGMGGNNNNNQMDMLQSLGGGGMGGSMNGMMSQGGNNNSGILKNDNASYQDRIAAQKKKVIRQQQQRLLLLRHASKCKDGPNCKTKFCGQMMTLWKHMKKCRDKNCKTSHCLSSRCVLNHYRICKSQGRTATCEVCGPVMEQIKRQDQGDGMDSSDPLAAKPDPDLPNQALPQLNQSMNQGSMGGQNQSNVQAMQQQAMQQLYQKQQQAIQQNQQGPQGGMQNQNNQMNQQNNQDTLQGLGGGGFQGNMQNNNDAMQNSQGSGAGNQNDPQQLQQAQQKLVQQQQVLKQLQKQQAQLSEQQKQLQEQQALLKDPTTQQGQQLQQQHALLQQLQRRCQQQQALIQQELVLQMKVLQQGGQGGQMNNSQNSQNSQQSPQQGQMVRQSSVGSQNQNQNQNNMQGNQLQAQMQALSQSAMAAMNDSSSNNNNNNNQMQQLQNQMQNQMQQMQNQVQNQLDSNIGGDLDPFGSEGVDQVDKSLDAMNAQQGSNTGTNEQQQQQSEQDNTQTSQDNKEDDSAQPNEPSSIANGDDEAQPMSQKSSDGDKTKAKRRTSAKARPVPPAGGRGKGARGRGGKGKRLRDIADDLGASSRLGDKDDEGGSKKRGADEISGGDGNDNAAKSSKTDPVPDSEKSQGSGKDGDSSLTSSMPKGDVEQHLLLLHKGLHLTSRTITHKCLPIVQQLIDDPFGWVFRDAVDPVVFGLPDYFEVVKNPMHLRLVKKKLENAVYTDMASFERDVKLVFENAILYNGEESEVGQLAKSMMGVFEREYKKVCEEIGSDLETVDPNACTLCGHERRQLEPPVLYCVGMACGMQRIQRNASYYTDPSKQNCWCEKCYSKMKDDEVITLDDGSMTGKSKLVAAKHDSLPEEAWIQCDDCKAQVHEVCALYNCRKARSKTTFLCPRCVLKNRESEDMREEHNHRACDLPSCKMSESMEHGLQQALGEAYKAKAAELGMEFSEVEKAEGLSIRVLSHIETKHTVRDLMYQRYQKVGCPADYPVHTKCVGLFQSIDGVDVMLYAMYVYEYGDECPTPNRRRVYISYLDSVQYLRPKCYRTIAYQSVIVEYLRFVKKRGFHTAHIWSCPPTPGDEYVFYCHPSHQKIPNEDMLRNWYIQTLDRAKEQGIVLETSNFHDEYFKKGGVFSPTGSAPSPTCLPYFEGDYIPGEIENIISHLSEEERRRLPESPPPPAVPKRSGSKLGTRSNPGQLVNQTQDKIMLRLGKAIVNMKDNFMIVRLRSKEFVAAVDRGEDVSGWHEDEQGTTPIKGKGDSSSLKKEDEKDGEQDRPSLEQIKSALSNKVGNTVDDDHQFESEMFENRQLFLNYCQGNHFQFDDLRHAKHSTLMILYQLHNPVIPKFFQKCGICYRDIVYGFRYKCIECTNFDLCKDCYHVFSDGATSSHRGPPVDHDKRHTFTEVLVVDPIATKKTEEERAKSLNAYLEVLTHAANCPGAPACKLNNCQKMKNLFVHVKTCDITNKKSCKICARLLSLIIVHARSCTRRGSCPLPFCDRIRERNERLRRQQQFMDDRRREAQNEHYASAMQS